eukprot:3163216-Pleurochrysis_carterae.AAC.2
MGLALEENRLLLWCVAPSHARAAESSGALSRTQNHDSNLKGEGTGECTCTQAASEGSSRGSAVRAYASHAPVPVRYA